MLAQGRLGNMVLLGGNGKAAEIRNGKEILHFSEIHGSHILLRKWGRLPGVRFCAGNTDAGAALGTYDFNIIYHKMRRVWYR